MSPNMPKWDNLEPFGRDYLEPFGTIWVYLEPFG